MRSLTPPTAFSSPVRSALARSTGPLALAFATVLAGSASAQTGEQEKQDPPPTLEDLQRQIDELREAQQRMPVTGGANPTMRIFGRIHLDYWGFLDSDPGINAIENDDPFDDPSDNIEFRRARLGVDGDIGEDMLYKIELEFGHPDEFSFKDLYFGWEGLPVAETLLVGNQKRPYGLDHLNSSRYNVFMERPFFIEADNQDARRLGVASYGVSENRKWNWRFGLFEMTDWSKSGEIVADQLQPEVAGRLASTVWYDEEADGRNYAHLAVSGMVGWPDGNDPGNRARYRTRPEARSQSRWIDTGAIGGAENNYLVGFETAVNLDALQFVGEYQSVWVEREGASTTHFHGAYAYLAYFLNGYMPWNRSRGTLARPRIDTDTGPFGAWQIALRYSYSDYTDAGIFGGTGESITLGLNCYFNSHASVQFNYIHGEIDDRMYDPDPPGGPVFSGGDYDIFGLRFRVDF